MHVRDFSCLCPRTGKHKEIYIPGACNALQSPGFRQVKGRIVGIPLESLEIKTKCLRGHNDSCCPWPRLSHINETKPQGLPKPFALKDVVHDGLHL
jgi:hypothetical protein